MRTDSHSMVEVERVTDESPTVRTLEFQDAGMEKALPGQFAMVWVPGVGELPMSVMVSRSGGPAFTVRRHGPSSTGLYETDRGGLIGVRGPYGNAFELRGGSPLLVGGGTGLVPLLRLLRSAGPGSGATLLIGARTAGEVFFDGMAKEAGCEVSVCTEDGTRGERGLVTGAAERLISGGRFDSVYTCGPEMMMAKVVSSANAAGVFVQASIERMMKCGVGICGSCCMGPELVCRDGTVFDGARLASNPDFGRAYRTKSGVSAAY